MKVFQSSIFRAICAIIIGALLVKYREEAVTWLTITIGALLFLSGVISCIVYFSNKRNPKYAQVFDAQGNPVTPPHATFPIGGIGTIILGALLALAPNLFVQWLMYILAAVLILGALNQFMNLASATKYARIGVAWWLLPSLVLLTGIVAIIKPSFIASAPLLVVGWCMMVYGAVDLVNAIKIYRTRKGFEKARAAADQAAAEAEQAKIEQAKAEALAEVQQTQEAAQPGDGSEESIDETTSPTDGTDTPTDGTEVSNDATNPSTETPEQSQPNTPTV